MKTKKIYLVVIDNYKQYESNQANVKGVFFNKKNAQCFARQLMQEDQIYRGSRSYIIKKNKL